MDNRLRGFSKNKTVAGFISLFSVSGVILLALTMAAEPFLSQEAEMLDLANGTTEISDSNASGSSAIKFASTLSGSGTVQPPSSYSGPITITEGGTYSGAWRSTSTSTPAVRISTSQPVIIENSFMEAPGFIVHSGGSHANVTVKNSRLKGTGSGGCDGRAIRLDQFVNARILNNTFETTGGIFLYQYQGNETTSQTVKIMRNYSKNIISPGGCLVQFAQMHDVLAPHMEIAWNETLNEPEKSRTEDNINIYLSGGTSSSPLAIHNNYISGGFAPDPADTGYTGGGIMMADGPDNNSFGPVHAYENQVVGMGNYGIAIAAGKNNVMRNNRVVTSGLYPDGSGKKYYGNVGIYVWNYHGGSGFTNNQSYDNQVGTMNTQKNARDDWWLPDCENNCSNSRIKSGQTITLADEQAEYTRWQNKLNANGISVGQGGSGSGDANYGTASGTLSVPETGKYRIWTRMMAPDSQNKFVEFHIGTAGFNIGGSAVSTSNWTWIGYRAGDSSLLMNRDLSQGNHTIQYVGTHPGVKVDRILLTQDLNCVPTGTGENCLESTPDDTTAPNVSLTSPKSGATLSGDTILSASASDNVEVARVEFLVDGNVISTKHQSPYEFEWASTTVANGSHTFNAKAYDTSGNSKLSSTTTASVSNSTYEPPSDGYIVKYRVNAGGPQISGEPDWGADSDTSSSQYVTGILSEETYSTTSNITFDSSVPSDTPDELFQAERWDEDGTTPMKYSFPAISGKLYKVRLYFAEIFSGAHSDGFRQMNVDVEGSRVLSNYDTYAEVGANRGQMKEFLTTPDSSLDIILSHGAADNPRIMGIEILESVENEFDESDLNSDGKVDLLDFSILASNFGKSGSDLGRSDINNDGKVDLLDFSVLASNFD